MTYRWLAIWLIALVGPAVAAADEPPKSLADQFAGIKKEHQEREKKFYNDLREHRKDDKKIGELNDEYHTFARKQAEALKALIKKHGDDPAAFEGVLVLVGELRYPLDDDLVKLVTDKHSANPKMGQLCYDLRYRSSEAWAEKILTETGAKHPDKAVRGVAVYSLGVYHRTRAQPYGQKLTEEEQQKRFAEAAKHFTEVTKAYAEVTTPDGKGKLGPKAAAELVRIKNIPNLKVGEPAPEITGEDIEGKPFKLSDYRGKVVLLDVWGHW